MPKPEQITSVPAGEFKAKCLALLDQVREQQCSFVVTKHGRPVARVVPLQEDVATDPYGCMRGTASYDPDAILSSGEAWEAEDLG